MTSSTLIPEPGIAAPVTPRPADRAPMCSFTIDVEDWYQSTVDLDAPITDRVVRNVDRVRAVLAAAGVKGTFFVQGMVAKAFPSMLRELLAEGHEIQSHGHSHRPLSRMDRKTLGSEIENARKSIEDACGVRPTAFRAPDFSILRENLWALEVLAEQGFEYDSSIFPMGMSRYGIAGWETGPRRVELPNGLSIVEVPVAVWQVGSLLVPVAGGGYFRLLPQSLISRALRSIITSGRPAIVYCHPYEFSPTELDDYRGRVGFPLRFTQGLGRVSFIGRVRHLLATLPFGRFGDVMATASRARQGFPALGAPALMYARVLR
jgi:polysaccharide deacetylase family protein (PEP-CTERM system associated)